MAFYYVKAGGTATGDGGRTTTARTGTWNATASEYYDTLSGAINATTAPIATDWILWSDASSDVITGDTALSLPDGVRIMSVSDSNQDQYSPATAAQVDNASGDQYQIRCASLSTLPYVIDGIHIVSGTYGFLTDTGAKLICHDTTWEYSNGQLWCLNQAHQHFINSDFKSVNGYVWTRDGSVFTMWGGDVDAGTGTYALRRTSGTSYTECIGATFSSTSATNIIQFDAGTGQSNWQPAIFSGCELPSNWTIQNLATSDKGSVVVDSCDSAYQYYEESGAGIIDFVTDVYYTPHDTLDDGLTKGSFEFETNSTTSCQFPLLMGNFTITQFLSAINTEASTKKNVRLRFVTESGDTLNDGDVVVYVFYPRSSAAYRKDLVVHRVSELESGSALSTETSNWQETRASFTLGTQYYIDVDMGSPGNGRVMVIPGITKASVTVFFSWQLEFAA